MVESNRDIEQFLRVGTQMMVHTQPTRRDSPRYRTTLRGWRSLQHLILDRPRDASGKYIVLEELGPCVLRFLLDGVACACSSQMLSWDSHRSAAYLRVRWPQELTHTTFRKAERVVQRLSCSVVGGDGWTASMDIFDLSACGCNMLSLRPCKEGDLLRLFFELPDGTKIADLRVAVRNVRPAKAGFVLGCETMPGQDLIVSDLAFFVTTTLARRRTEPEPPQAAPTVLVLDVNPGLFEALRGVLALRGMEVIWAGNVLDAMHRLRVLMPVAVFISQALPSLSAVDFCRIVRGVEGFQLLPIFVYGTGDQLQRDRTRMAGASGFVVESASLRDDLVFAVDSVLKHAVAS